MNTLSPQMGHTRRNVDYCQGKQSKLYNIGGINRTQKLHILSDTRIIIYCIGRKIQNGPMQASSYHLIAIAFKYVQID